MNKKHESLEAVHTHTHTNSLKKNKGITLVALVVTIVVLLILAGVTINLVVGQNGIINRAKEAKIATEFSSYSEQLEMFLTNKNIENPEFSSYSLNAGKNNLSYNTQNGNSGTIKDVISNIDGEYLEKLQIINGKLVLRTQNNREISYALKYNIQVNSYKLEGDGEIVSSKENIIPIDKEGTLTIPENVKKIGTGAFSGIENLRKVIIPSSVTEIESDAFSNNKNLEEVQIEGNVQKIGEKAFSGSIKLNKINLPESITYIGSYAFSSTGLTDVIIPKNLKNIETAVFAWTNIKEVIIPEGIEKIGAHAFNSCKMENVKIPSTISSIESSAFANCSNLTSIDVSNNKKFLYENGFLLSSDMKNIVFINKNYIVDTLTIPEGIVSFNTMISDYDTIKHLIIPSSLKTLDVSVLPSTIENVEIKSGNKDFILGDKIIYNNDNKLIMCFSKEEDILIPEGITSIGDYSLKYATNAKNITLPVSVTSIGRMVCSGLSKLQNFNIKQNVDDINVLAIPHIECNVNIDDNNPYYVVKDNILYKMNEGKKENLVSVLYYIKGTIKIDKEVKIIGSHSFYEQKFLTEINIPEGVTKIEESAFHACQILKKVIVPKSVEQIINSFNTAPLLDEIIVNNTENSIKGAPWGASKGIQVVSWNEK